MHVFEGFVDIVQGHREADHLIYLDFPSQIHFHVFGKLRAALYAAEGSALPHASSDQLEGACGDFLTGTRHTDDDRLAPALVAAFQRRAHQIHVTHAFKGVIHTPVGHVDDNLLQGRAVILGIHRIGGTELLGELELGRVHVHRDDARSLGQRGALDHAQPDAPQAEYRHGGSRFHLGRIQHGADTGGHSAAEQANLVQGRLGVDLRQGDFGKHRVFGKRGGAHVVEYRAAVAGEARGAVGHEPLSLGRADRLAQIGLARRAEFTLTAFRRIERNHVIARFDAAHLGPHLLDDGAAFMPQHGRENPLRIGAR